MSLRTYLSLSALCIVMIVVGVDGSKKGCGIVKQASPSHQQVDLIVFSYNRPLQLYALLESVKTYITGLASCCVIYRTSSDDYQHGYNQVIEEFPHVTFMRQGANPRSDFKPLVLQALKQSGDYVIFAVDDIIVTGHVDLTECVDAIEKTGAYGFYLRLGTHLTECYAMKMLQKVPDFTVIEGKILQWIFGRAELDWGYPNTVDMTVYRKKDVEPAFFAIDYVAPNTLEGHWHAYYTRHLRDRAGLCYSHAKIVNLPLNRVQGEYNNRAMNSFSPDELLKIFNDGFKIDIRPLFTIDNKSAHMEYMPIFIKRAGVC